MNKPLNLLQNLSDRAIFRVTGNDAERYLNGQVSQDVKLASESAAVYSIVANFKGKLEGDFFVRRHQGDLLIDTCESQRESLFSRLDKYLIADDAEIVDVSDEYHFCHVIGSCEHEFSHPNWECNRYGEDGTDYLLPASVCCDLYYQRTLLCLDLLPSLFSYNSYVPIQVLDEHSCSDDNHKNMD